METSLVLISSFGYLLLLFGIAYWAEKKTGKNIAKLKSYIYALSMAVYCTAWTFYGSIGRAAEIGPDYLAIYIGPTIAAPLWFLVLKKIIRICKVQRITSIADFISSRYGKDTSLGTLATVVCILGVIPYISLQIKAIAVSFEFLTQASSQTIQHDFWQISFSNNTPFWITVLLAVFIIIFGTRKIDSTEKHEGMVTAVAFESIIKLVAFLTGGIFIVFFLFNGFGDIFFQASAIETLKGTFVFSENKGYTDWFAMCVLSMLAILLLPRQFQVSVVENVDEKHLNKAIWIFPLYLFAINIFVLPIAMAGKLHFASAALDADFSILSLPVFNNNTALSLLIYIGGFSAATGMIIVETIALSVMLSNNLLIPLILKINFLKEKFIGNVESAIKFIRRLSIILILLLAYAYFTEVAESYTLVATGLISFAAVAQFAPAVIGGIYWRRANKVGALIGISAGFLIWFYTLVIPAMVGAGLLSTSILSEGLFGLALLKPNELFGLNAFSPLTHSFFWSILINVICYVVGSLYVKAGNQEKIQAQLFVNVFEYNSAYEGSVNRTGRIKYDEIQSLLDQFLGAERTKKLLDNFHNNYNLDLNQNEAYADQRLLTHSEKVLSGVIGSASARILLESVVKEEEISINEVVEIIKESQQLISLNKELKHKSEELKKASEALAVANAQMKEADLIKDEFLYTITHELRTPLTSIRAFSEILFDNPEIDSQQRQQFLGTMIKEIERLSRLITQVLDLEKLESGKQHLTLQLTDVDQLINEATASFSQLIKDKSIYLEKLAEKELPLIEIDKDLMTRVIQNLVSNAIKYVDNEKGRINIAIVGNEENIKISIKDNGTGINEKHMPYIFNKFYQVQHLKTKNEGSGLGLAISKRIIELHKGQIWVENEQGSGANFSFTIPIKR